MSQVEATAGLLAPQFLDLQITGRMAERAGNADPTALLHGVFPTRGDDRWITIEARDRETFERLVAVLCAGRARPAIFDAADAELKQRRTELEATIDDLTAERDGFELQQQLREADVPVGVALHAPDLFEDAALTSRNHFRMLDHPEMGQVAYNGPAYRFEATPSRLTKAAPLLGEDTEHVMRDLLDIPQTLVTELRESGVLR